MPLEDAEEVERSLAHLNCCECPIKVVCLVRGKQQGKLCEKWHGKRLHHGKKSQVLLQKVSLVRLCHVFDSVKVDLMALAGPDEEKEDRGSPQLRG